MYLFLCKKQLFYFRLKKEFREQPKTATVTDFGGIVKETAKDELTGLLSICNHFSPKTKNKTNGGRISSKLVGLVCKLCETFTSFVVPT